MATQAYTEVQRYRKTERQYKLTVGDYRNGRGILIDSTDTDRPLQITFDVAKSSDIKNGSANSANIEIYNLNPEQEELLDSRFLETTLHVGYNNEEGMKLLVSGNVTECSTAKYGTDTITQLRLGEGYVALTQSRLKSIVSPGKTVQDVIDVIASNMPGVARGPIVGTNLSSPIIHGWRLSGTAREELDKITKAYGLEYNVTNDVLTVTDVNGPISKAVVNCPVISSATGMIDQPFRTTEQARLPKKDKRVRYGVQFKVLLDAALMPGQVVKLESERISGYFRINSVRFSGEYRSSNQWYAECQCSEMTSEDVTIV